MVKQQSAPVMEMFGKYSRTLNPGFNWKLPVCETVAFYHSLKEQVLDIDSQTAITKDNVKIRIDGVLYFKIQDPQKASYEVAEPVKALSLLAQTSMRSEIGLLELDRTFEEREYLNTKIKAALQLASVKWGIDCMRYEIKDIKPPDQIKRSMELQAESERVKRSQILNSEGDRDSAINKALGTKQSLILQGEGAAQQITQEARGIVSSLEEIAAALRRSDGTMNESALRLRLSQQYIGALNKIYAESKFIVLPQSSGASGQANNQTDAIITALALFKQFELGGSSNAQMDPTLLNGIKDQLRSFEQRLVDTPKDEQRKQIRFFDDKALY